MSKVEIEEINLIGLPLNGKTSNANGQSGIDCGNLWQQFEKGQYSEKIPGKLSEEIYAVYHQYEGDYTKPYSYFIGCKVSPGTEVPEGLISLVINSGTYQKILAKGKMPDCVADAWREIWSSDISRKYEADFEVYDERSRDWSKAEVDIYLSIKS
jgi:predicted transcriptional regulator YdeE